MPAWNEARRAGGQARSGAQAERAAPEGSRSELPQAKERFARGVCVYCGAKGNGRRVGLLPLTGKVFFCRDHAEQYRDSKAWEAAHKLELGL